MKQTLLVISLMIYSIALAQQTNHPDYFEKYWTPSVGFVTQNYNDYYVFGCTALIATDSTYVGAGLLGLQGGWQPKSYTFSIDSLRSLRNTRIKRFFCFSSNNWTQRGRLNFWHPRFCNASGLGDIWLDTMVNGLSVPNFSTGCSTN